jgi:ribonuclease P protein component
MSETFPAALRLRKRSEFLEVQNHGKRVSTGRFLVLALARPGHPSRVGVTVSKRVAGAVGRNRIKRVVREVVRRNRDRLPAGFQIVVVARREAVGAGYRDTAAELTRALGRIALGGPR